MKKTIQIALPIAMTVLWSCIASAQPDNNSFPVKVNPPADATCTIDNNPVGCQDINVLTSTNPMKITAEDISLTIEPIKPQGPQSQGTLAAFVLSDGNGLPAIETGSNCIIKNEAIGTNLRLRIISMDAEPCEIDIK